MLTPFRIQKLLTVKLLNLQLLIWSDIAVLSFKCSFTFSISDLKVNPTYWMLLSLEHFYT